MTTVRFFPEVFASDVNESVEAGGGRKYKKPAYKKTAKKKPRAKKKPIAKKKPRAKKKTSKVIAGIKRVIYTGSKGGKYYISKSVKKYIK